MELWDSDLGGNRAGMGYGGHSEYIKKPSITENNGLLSNKHLYFYVRPPNTNTQVPEGNA
jgi:hypothetical protein